MISFPNLIKIEYHFLIEVPTPSPLLIHRHSLYLNIAYLSKMLLLGDALLGKNNNFFGKIFFMQRIFEKATGRIWMIDNILDQRDVS